MKVFTGKELFEVFGGIATSFQAMELLMEIDHMKWRLVKNRFSDSWDVRCGNELIAEDLAHCDADRLALAHNRNLERLISRLSDKREPR